MQLARQEFGKRKKYELRDFKDFFQGSPPLLSLKDRSTINRATIAVILKVDGIVEKLKIYLAVFSITRPLDYPFSTI